MTKTAIIVLPGLDGSDLLLDHFASLAPSTQPIYVHALPDDPKDDYESLCTKISQRITELDSCHLIAESFSGPLGILLAHRHPKIINRLTLVASFATSPAPSLARIVPWSLLLRIPMPRFIARRYFVGNDPSLIMRLKESICRTSTKTLVRRVQCLLSVDVTTQLSELKCRLMYLRPKHDRLISKRALSSIISANPKVVVRTIDGPHLILQTFPQQCWECILDADRTVADNLAIN